jgi:hypothetical protein
MGRSKISKKREADLPEGTAMKHPPKARAHSGCGRPLENVYLTEVIPVIYLGFDKGNYHEVDPPEIAGDGDLLFHEVRCGHCNAILAGADLDYIKKRTPELKDYDV